MTAEFTPYQEFDHIAGLLLQHVHVTSPAEGTADLCDQVQLQALPDFSRILSQKFISVIPKATFSTA